MFQTFDEKTVSETSKNRIYLLREEMRKKNIDAFLIPRNDAHMGEYVSDRDKRLEWLSALSLQSFRLYNRLMSFLEYYEFQKYFHHIDFPLELYSGRLRTNIRNSFK